jgi:pilus assembly protein Flp/PilA
MLHMYTYLESLLRKNRDERGATAVEYGIMVALIAVAIIVVVGLLGDKLNILFDTVENSL